MDTIKKENNKKRDILEYLQCMVNTETPTPINVVNKMLDLIPVEVYENDNSTFLCPCCKDGIFLREIAIRILKHKYNKLGKKEFLKNQNKILQHILEKQLFGITISYRGYEVTKRTLYTNNLINLYNVNNVEKQKEITEIKKEEKIETKNENNIKKINNKIQNTTKDKYSVFSEFFKHHFTDYINKAKEEREKEREKQEQIEKEKYIRKIIVKRNTNNIFFSIERHNNNEEAFLAKRQIDERIKPGSVPKIEKEGKINIKQSKEDIIKDLNEEIDFYLYGYKKTIKETENITTNNTNSNTYYNWYENNYKEIEEHSRNIDRVKKCCYNFSEVRWFVNAIHNNYFKHKINIKDKKQEYININNIYFNEELGKLAQDKDGNETEIQALHFIENFEEISQFFDSKGVRDMQFDVVIGNPPYSMKTGGKSHQLYLQFFKQSFQYAKRSIMIFPNGWLTASGQGSGMPLAPKIRENKNIVSIDVYYEDIKKNDYVIFNNVAFGAVNIVYWEKNFNNKGLVNYYEYGVYKGQKNLTEIKTKDSIDINILNKTKSNKYFDLLVTGRNPFGIGSALLAHPEKYNFTQFIKQELNNDTIEIFDGNSGIEKWYIIDKNIQYKESFSNKTVKTKLGNKDKWKVCYGKMGANTIYRRLFIIEPNKICSDSFLCIYADTKLQAENIITYLKTYFVRYLIKLNQITFSACRNVFASVPDISNKLNPRTNKIGWESDWSNEDLQQLFNLTNDEMEYIKEQAIQADNGKGGDEVDDSKNEVEEEDE